MTQHNVDSSEDLHPIHVSDLGKCYQIYAKPTDRLKQALWRGRRKYYREFWALRNVDLEIKAGETVAIIGRNGSGKSTLLQMICGTLAPTEGSVRTSGTIAALLELGSGFNPEFTGIENVFLNASLLGLTQEQIRAKLEDIQAFADIGDFVNQPVKTYSSGMLVRLAFAVIAHVEPSVLIVDEALSVGDAVFGQRCMRFIRRFTEQGTLLFVSHDLNAVSSLCERAIWIDSGRVRMDTATAAILTAYTRSCLEASNAEVEQAKITSGTAGETGSPTENREKRGLSETGHASKTIEFDWERSMAIPDGQTHGTQGEKVNWDSERDYGNGQASIISVVLREKDGDSTTAPKCGEEARLEIVARCETFIESFIAGFVVRDRTGQIIFGESSIGKKKLRAESQQMVTFSFGFTMPFLRPGSYSLSAAVSNGDATGFQVLHYKTDTLVFEPMVGERPIYGVFATTTMNIRVAFQEMRT
ncbi:ABC transporter ATP-binding protein [Cyanobium gracile UHCC 0139]|uniref:ABC transporter ATP-binding protein n=1 Tax=Cyanobium gracile UHCC 0139 TaxID=3110308 RepID=A0ABU5RRA2_9CYAN|nr:ABC transporter ATP-binding protein [Cyanobium gracile]MEA5390276.1 ABC transporter ATP-binding protein [Cyanobium gracile UHCC 0139]